MQDVIYSDSKNCCLFNWLQLCNSSTDFHNFLYTEKKRFELPAAGTLGYT